LFHAGSTYGIQRCRVRHLNCVSSQSSKEAHAKSSPRYTELPSPPASRAGHHAPSSSDPPAPDSPSRRRSSDVSHSQATTSAHTLHTSVARSSHAASMEASDLAHHRPRAGARRQKEHTLHPRDNTEALTNMCAAGTSLGTKQSPSITHNPTLRAEKGGGGHRNTAIQETRRAPMEKSKERRCQLIHRG
jgi:hypothetical protein